MVTVFAEHGGGGSQVAAPSRSCSLCELFSGSITGSHPVPEERPRLRLLSSIDGGLILSALPAGGHRARDRAQRDSEMVVDYFPRQAGWVAIGLVLLVISIGIDYHVLLDLSVVLYGLGVVSLVAVLGFGIMCTAAQPTG